MQKNLSSKITGLVMGCFIATAVIIYPTEAGEVEQKPPFLMHANSIKQIIRQAPTLNPNVLVLGLKAYEKVKREGWNQRPLLTIVDYSKPSSELRLWVLNLENNTVLFHDYVAHGKNSGWNFAKKFSNQIDSFQSSLGLLLTSNPYMGRNGYSLRLIGLERGFNHNAASRNIVFHASQYVNKAYVDSNGRLGRSWGCFAVSSAIVRRLIDTIQGGTLVLSYYPDRNWLSQSRFLT